MREIKKCLYVLLFCAAVYSGTSIQVNGAFLQGWLFLLSVFVYPVLTLKHIFSLVKREKIASFLFTFSLTCTYFFALLPQNHLIAIFRLSVLILATMTFVAVGRRFPKVVNIIYLVLTVGTVTLIVLTLVGYEMGFVVGERFGMARPFLYANPITIGVMLSLICIYYIKNNNKVFSFITFTSSLAFSSATGLLSFLYYYSKRFLLILIIFSSSLYFVLNLSDLGSMLIRLNTLLYTAPLVRLFEPSEMIFGVGLRGLEIWNGGHNVLIIANDLTMFVKVLFELGAVGFFTLIFLCWRVYLSEKRLGVIFVILLLSIDQIFHYWILPFYFVLFSAKGNVKGAAGRLCVVDGR